MERELHALVLFQRLSDLNDNYNPDVMSRSKARLHRENVLNVLAAGRSRINSDRLDEDIFREYIVKKAWNLEILWFLSAGSFISLSNYFKEKESMGEVEVEGLVEDLVYLYFTGENNTFRREMRGGMSEELARYCETEANTSQVLAGFAEEYYKWLKSKETCHGIVLPLMESFASGAKGVHLFLLLVKVAKCSFHDNGITSHEAMATLKFSELNRTGLLPKFFKQLVDCAHDSVCQFLSATLLECKQDSKINWNNVALLVLAITKSNLYPMIKEIIHSLIEYSLKNRSSSHLYIAFLLGRMCCRKDSGVSMTYLQWYSSTFSCDSHRPLNTDEKAQFFLQCLKDVLYMESPYYTKVHVHKVASVPSSCQANLSEYLQLAKASLLSMNESIELGIFENPDELKTTENDVRCLVNAFKKTGKVPPTFLASLTFRRQYFERELLPQLLSSCGGVSSTQHALIKLLATSGKISKGIYMNHVEECRGSSSH